VGGVPGHPRNVAAANADISELAVVQARKLIQAAIIALPLADQADNIGKHKHTLFPDLFPKNRLVPIFE